MHWSREHRHLIVCKNIYPRAVERMAHIQYVDSLIREYLLFRGFGNTLKTFDTELKTDKDKGFRVDKIIDQITHSINSHDLQSLRDIWNHLDGHLFSKLEHSFATGNPEST